eukprot:UN27179
MSKVKSSKKKITKKAMPESAEGSADLLSKQDKKAVQTYFKEHEKAVLKRLFGKNYEPKDYVKKSMTCEVLNVNPDDKTKVRVNIAAKYNIEKSENSGAAVVTEEQDFWIYCKNTGMKTVVKWDFLPVFTELLTADFGAERGKVD